MDLFTFLNNVRKDAGSAWGDAVISEEMWNWLERYLQPGENSLDFKNRVVGTDPTTGEPIYDQHYAIMGQPMEIFCMLTQVMMSNAAFAAVVVMAAQFYTDHMPTCSVCSHYFQVLPPLNEVTEWHSHDHPSIKRT